MFLRRSVPLSSIDVDVKFYGDRPRGTPPSEKLNATGEPNIAILDLSKALSRKRCNDEVIINH